MKCFHVYNKMFVRYYAVSHTQTPTHIWQSPAHILCPTDKNICLPYDCWCQDFSPHGQFAPWTFPMYRHFATWAIRPLLGISTHRRFAHRRFAPWMWGETSVLCGCLCSKKSEKWQSVYRYGVREGKEGCEREALPQKYYLYATAYRHYIWSFDFRSALHVACAYVNRIWSLNDIVFEFAYTCRTCCYTLLLCSLYTARQKKEPT